MFLIYVPKIVKHIEQEETQLKAAIKNADKVDAICYITATAPNMIGNFFWKTTAFSSQTIDPFHTADTAVCLRIIFSFSQPSKNT